MGILKRHAECCSMIRKFRDERIRIWGIDEGIPDGGIACVVGCVISDSFHVLLPQENISGYECGEDH